MNKNIFAILLLCSIFTTTINAALIVNPPQAITERVTVQIIQTDIDEPGGTPATVFGNAAQEAEILANIDTIWAQAGIDIEFLPTVIDYQDSFAFQGVSAPRPTSDLNTIITNATGEGGIINPDPLVINMFFVEIVPGFSFTSENTANGLAFVGGNGITQFVGENLLTFAVGRELIAQVVSHEIGHNLGLPHFDLELENLMQTSGDVGDARLNAAQVTTALASGFSQVVAVPEPGTYMLLILLTLGFWGRKRFLAKKAA